MLIEDSEAWQQSQYERPSVQQQWETRTGDEESIWLYDSTLVLWRVHVGV